MLPMMAGLPAMAELCRAEPTSWIPGARTAVALHLLAMLVPAWWPWRATHAVPLLLLAGGQAVISIPGSAGLMLGMGLQAMAWGCTWRDSLVPLAWRGCLILGPGTPARGVRFLPATVVPLAPTVAWSLPPLLLGIAALLLLPATTRVMPTAGSR